MSETPASSCSTGDTRRGNRRNAHKVIVEDWNGSANPDKFKTIARNVLLPVVNKDIVISVPHCRIKPLSSDGKFHIEIWSSPEKLLPLVPPPKEMWGQEVSCYDSLYRATGSGEAIIDETTGWAVAELFPDNLYIHFDICHNGDPEELKIFKLLLKRVAEFLQLSPADKAKLKKQDEEKILTVNKERYAKLLLTFSQDKNSRDDSREQVEEMERQIKQHRVALTRLLFSREVINRKRADTSSRFRSREKLLIEFDQLRSMPKIKDVTVYEDDVISVTTDILYCRNKVTGLLYEIGAFRLDIRPELPIDDEDFQDNIAFTNLTRVIKTGLSQTSQHPHIFNTKDNFCLGNAEEIIPELLSGLEIKALISVMIQFIESVNLDDSAGKELFLWPLAPLKMQSPAVQDELKRLRQAGLWGRNPFSKVDDSHCSSNFIKIAKSSPKNSVVVWQLGGDHWCLNGRRDDQVYTDTLARWLKVTDDWVYAIMRDYFFVISNN
ncbi:MAG: hypothetical protein WCT16_03575 [Candidatus Buchananbacteria bacterium]